MKTIYRGSLVNFQIDKPYDYIKISNKNIYNGNPYYIPLEFEIQNEYDNFKKYIPLKEIQLVVNYISRIKCDDKFGILKYREFDDLEVTKENVVHYEVYNLKYPFLISEYFDGTDLIIELSEVKINYKILSKGFVKKLEMNTFRISCSAIPSSFDFLITGKNFYYAHSSKFDCKYNFNIINVINNVQIRIFPISLIDLYASLDDSKKDELITFYNKNNDLGTKLLFYDETKNLKLKFTEERVYEIEEIIIFNTEFNTNFKTVINSYNLMQNGNLVIFDEMKIFINDGFL